ncbi:MAG: hypothetical protein COA86_07665 [Kangiella sp.]|nr:MAG: hypothetical protein COA86_07665 [Kangiella sp.]
MNHSKFTQLNSLASIDLIGTEVTQFLDGQLSIDTKSLETHLAKLACFCTHKGRIASLFHILLIENGVRLLLPKSIIEATQAHIKKYAVFFKVEITSNTTELFAICDNQMKTPVSAQLVKIDQTDLQVSFEESDSKELDDSFWFSQLAENQIAWLTQETLEHFLPHNLNLPALKAIDFKKGCFTGQEVIARMQYKGKLKQHLQSLQCQENIEIPSKSKLFQNGKSIGEVICSVTNYANNVTVLALIKDSANLSKHFQTSSENSPILEITS